MPTRAKRNNRQTSTELKNWLLDEENRPGSYSLSVENDDLPSLLQTQVRWRCPNLLKSRIISRALKFTAIFTSGVLFALLVFPLVDWPIHDAYDGAFRGFRSSFDISPNAPDYPIDFLNRVLPVACHSHNDYWRQRPLYSALGSGCISVEADIWLVNNDLLVGHSFGELDRKKTLRAMYIDPLVKILELMNAPTSTSPEETRAEYPKGVFYQEPKQSLTLLIDFKTAGQDLWPHVLNQLKPLSDRGWLTFWNGETRIERPVTVVGTGNTPFEMVTSNATYRDIFFDAPLEALNDNYNPSNSFYASSSLTRAVGPLFQFTLSGPQTELVRKQIYQARDQGLVPRYWGTPRWPRGLRDEFWGLLLKEGVGILNVDDLRAARKGNWGSWPQVVSL